MKRIFTAFTALFLLVAGSSAQSGKYKNLDSAVTLLSSYYNAINEKDYRRAFGYWRSPTNSFENFVKAYAETEKVRLIVEPPTLIEGAADGVYTRVPTVLISTLKNGEQQMFTGCYTMSRSNLRSSNIPKKDKWRIQKADLKLASVETKLPALLDEACAKESNKNTENAQARIPGMLHSESGQASDAVSMPQTVRVNQPFRITVMTSGNGCVSKGDTNSILGENGADLFIYDLTTATSPETVCTMIFKTFEHTATLKFTKRGEAIVRVWARDRGNSPMGKPVMIEKRVNVQ